MPILVPGTADRPALTVNIVFAPASPTGRLADAELLFHDGAFAGLTLTRFSVWDRPVRGYKVTVPRRPSPAGVAQQSARALRCLGPGHDLDGFQKIIVQAYVDQAAERKYREWCRRRSARKSANVRRDRLAAARAAEAR